MPLYCLIVGCLDRLRIFHAEHFRGPCRFVIGLRSSYYESQDPGAACWFGVMFINDTGGGDGSASGSVE